MEPTKNPAAAQAEVIAQLAREGVAKHYPITIDPKNIPAGVVPRLVWPDKTITDLEGTLPKPLRKRGTATLGAVGSFIDYVNAHKETNTAICGDADEKGGSFTAIIDYHGATTRRTDEGQHVDLTVVTPGQPAWSEHRVVMKLEPTPEWVRWLGICGKDLDQRTFAEFIEDNAADVVVPEDQAKAPNAQELMQVATTLQIKTDVRFASSVNLQNGQIQLRYEEMINGTWGGEGGIAVPQAFHIGVVPFRGGQRYLARIRLRYRGTSGKASFRLEMERPHKIVEAAFRDTKAMIEGETEITVWIGSLNPQTRPVV